MLHKTWVIKCNNRSPPATGNWTIIQSISPKWSYSGNTSLVASGVICGPYHAPPHIHSRRAVHIINLGSTFAHFVCFCTGTGFLIPRHSCCLFVLLAINKLSSDSGPGELTRDQSYLESCFILSVVLLGSKAVHPPLIHTYIHTPPTQCWNSAMHNVVTEITTALSVYRAPKACEWLCLFMKLSDNL